MAVRVTGRVNTDPVSRSRDSVVVIGPASWNTLVRLAELPGARPQTVYAEDSWSTLGGTSAGKALHFADLSVPVTLSTVVGEDPEAELVCGALSNDRITLVAERVDGQSERHLNLMADGARLSIYLSLPQTPVGALPAPTLQAIEAAGHVVLDLSRRAGHVTEVARASRATVWTDLHNYDGESAFHRPFLDAADIVFLSNEALGDPRPFMAKVLSTGKRLVVCTLGADGAIALNSRGWHRVAAVPTEVIDTNGAGDAFLAGFLAATREGAEVQDALESGARQAARALSTRHLSPALDQG